MNCALHYKSVIVGLFEQLSRNNCIQKLVCQGLLVCMKQCRSSHVFTLAVQQLQANLGKVTVCATEGKTFHQQFHQQFHQHKVSSGQRDCTLQLTMRIATHIAGGLMQNTHESVCANSLEATAIIVA